ncbi:ribosomal protein S5 domain 2-type protein [Multifurca ochricompacta]|uniref:Ribosomal protein S5 domain 2-type protein n=1 Tax=Multifurca ochricompacta TaxID=376703 RepID=A0AAD4M1B6_9AGAM|nr:ribosomal protein S5 domain 2-type protein [Multifurca ochricompacta]
MSFTRPDGRGNEDKRPLHIIYERLDRVDGSARFGFGDTKALASVSGPIEVRLAAEQPSKATFDVTVRPLSSLPGTESKALATSLRGLLSPSLILSRNPRTLLQLVVQSLTPSPIESYPPSLAAACINASSLALLNAGSIPMTGVVCAAGVALFRSTTEEDIPALVLDPSESESREAVGCGCFAFLFRTEIAGSQPLPTNDTPGARLVWTNWHVKDGTSDDGELARAQALGLAGAETIWRAIKQSVPQMDNLPPPPLPSRSTAGELGIITQSDEVSDQDMNDAKIEI